MKINLDLLTRESKLSQATIVEWCFANLKPYTWGLKSISGATYLYFDNPTDVELFNEGLEF